MQTQKKATILIDYNHLPIRCKFCFNTSHSVKDCPNMSDTKRAKGKSTGQGSCRTGREEPRNTVSNPDRDQRVGDQYCDNIVEVDGWTTILPWTQRRNMQSAGTGGTTGNQSTSNHQTATTLVPVLAANRQGVRTEPRNQVQIH